MKVDIVLLGVLALWIALVVHELGHLIAGRMVRFRFGFFAAGPILVERAAHGSIRIRWNREPAFFGGAAMSIPDDGENAGKRLAIMIAGGPCASLLLALIAACALAFSAHLSAAVQTEAQWLRLLSSAVFLGTALPLPNGAFITDGARLLRILRGGALGARETALATLLGFQRSGVRPANWDADLIVRALTPSDASMFEFAAQQFAYERALDLGDTDAARIHQARAAALSVGLPRRFRSE